MNPQLHFILGGGMTEQQWSDLGKSITSYYKGKIKATYDINFYHYTDDVATAIMQKQPDGPIILVGHSFGGCRSVETAVALNKIGRVVDHLVLFDPVEITAWDKPNTKGFALPPNVWEAVCVYRGAKEVPFSGMINGGYNFKNIGYTGAHGDCVWNIANVAMIDTALAGGFFLPAVAKPNVGPAPTPNPKLLSITLGYADGTQRVIQVP